MIIPEFDDMIRTERFGVPDCAMPNESYLGDFNGQKEPSPAFFMCTTACLYDTVKYGNIYTLEGWHKNWFNGLLKDINIVADDPRIMLYVLALTLPIGECMDKVVHAVSDAMYLVPGDSFVAKMYQFFMIPTNNSSVVNDLIFSMAEEQVEINFAYEMGYAFSSIGNVPNIRALSEWGRIDPNSAIRYLKETSPFEKLVEWRDLCNQYVREFQNIKYDEKSRPMNAFRR
jgi:hypothetical protein